MSGHRQAAVALHGLDARDQRAILAELPEPDQDILRGLLAELTELGFEKTVGSALASAPTPGRPAVEESDPDTDARRTVRSASPAAMFAVLGHEPARLQGYILSLERWPWTEGFLELLPSPRRALVSDALRAGFAPAPARTGFLLQSAARALRETQRPVAPPPAGLLSRTLIRLASWTR